MTKLDYAFWFGLISCISIIITWIVSYMKHRFNLSVSYPLAEFGRKNMVLMYLSFANYSDQNAIIESMEIIQDNKVLKCIEIPEEVISSETKCGNTILSHSETYSTALPLTIFGHSSYSGYFIAYDFEANQIDPYKPVKIRIHANHHHVLETEMLMLSEQ